MNNSKKTILLVEDEIYIRQSFADYFEDHHWQIIQAESGEQALEILKHESPDGAIVDIRMGGMDGDAFIREAYRKKPNLAFIVCTGSPEYDVPNDLVKLPCVSSHLYKKPVIDMATLEKDLLQLIETMNKKKV